MSVFADVYYLEDIEEGRGKKKPKQQEDPPSLQARRLTGKGAVPEDIIPTLGEVRQLAAKAQESLTRP